MPFHKFHLKLVGFLSPVIVVWWRSLILLFARLFTAEANSTFVARQIIMIIIPKLKHGCLLLIVYAILQNPAKNYIHFGNKTNQTIFNSAFGENVFRSRHKRQQ